MDILLGKTVKIKEVNSQTNLKIVYYLHQVGIVKGYKKIYKNYNVPIIEFQDYTRIWMLPSELDIIQINQKSNLSKSKK